MVDLRLATAGDVPAVLEFWLRAGENTDRHDSRRAVDALVAWDPEALILATAGEAIAGTIIVGWDGWRCSLYRFAVDPARRRQGIGRALIGAAEERARSLQAFRVDAMVLDANDLGRAAWAAAGYTEQTDSTRWVKRLS